MRLEAKVGLLRDRLLVEDAEYPLRRDGGWITVPPIGSREGGRVRYDALRDRIRIVVAQGAVEIPFHWRHTTFLWRGSRYAVGPMAWGHVMVTCGTRPVATGRLTMSGVRFGYVAAELEGIASELAVGLAYRAMAMWIAAGAAGASA